MKRRIIPSFRLSPDYLALCLNKCLKGKTLRPGNQVHAALLASGIDMNVLSLSSKLVGLYASCGDMTSAKLLFRKIRKPNVFAFNWMVFASAFNGDSKGAFGYFRLMQNMEIAVNKLTLLGLLKACLGLADVKMGKKVHTLVIVMGFDSDASIANAVIDMYHKCGSFGYASKVFDRMSERDIACWTTMINGCFGIGETEIANRLFERMKLEGPKPNEFTWNAMIAGYARCGDTDRAFKLFDGMKREGCVPDLITWNAMISGFSQSQNTVEALGIFRDMLLSGIRPNRVTITGLLPICGLIGSIQLGRQIHGSVFRMGLGINAFVACALVDMYSKCGNVRNARYVFHSVSRKNVPLWNSMIGCYGKHGMVDSLLHLFERMQEEGIKVNEVTLVSVLSACSHSGLLQRGLEIFGSMKDRYGVEASKEHYACLVDLLCRSGEIEEAYKVVKGMPMEVTESIAGSFLHGCKVHGRKDLAKLMAEDIMGMELNQSGDFVTLSNIHASHCDWKEVQNTRKVMKEKKFNKTPGFSWLDKNNL